MRITLISSWFRNWRVFVCYLRQIAVVGIFLPHELFMRILLLESLESTNLLHKVKPVLPIQLSFPWADPGFPGWGEGTPGVFLQILLNLPLISIVKNMFLKHNQIIDHCWKGGSPYRTPVPSSLAYRDPRTSSNLFTM